MTKFAVSICLVLSMATLIAGLYPSNGQVSDSGFRYLTVQFDEMTNWNASGNATQKMYEFDYKFKDQPKYFVPSTHAVLDPNPNITIKNLLINQKIELRVAFKPTPAALRSEDFSQWATFSVRDASEAGPVIVPGKVRNLNVMKNPDNESTHSAIITFNDPENIVNSNNSNDTSVQYIVEACIYNPFTKASSDCSVLTVFLRNMSSTSQTTLKRIDSYKSNIQPSKTKNMMFKVIGVSLNGTRGESAELVKRLDPTSLPKAPVNITSSDLYADELKLSMEVDQSPSSIYIQYNIKGNATKMMKYFGTSRKNPEFKIDGLTAETEYEFQAGILTQNYGGSQWSAKYTVKTTNVTAPTPAPRTTPSSASLLMSSFCSILFSLFIIVYVNKQL